MISCAECIINTYTKRQALHWKRQLCHKIRIKPTLSSICKIYGLFGAAAMIRVIAFEERNDSINNHNNNNYSSSQQEDLSDNTININTANPINFKLIALTFVIFIISDILISQLIRLVLHKRFITRRTTNTNITTPTHALLKQFFLSYIYSIAVLLAMFILLPRMLACSLVFTALNTLLIYQNKIAKSSHSTNPSVSSEPSQQRQNLNLFQQFRERIQDLFVDNFQSNRSQQHNEIQSDEDNQEMSPSYNSGSDENNSNNNGSDSDNDLTDDSRVLLSYRRRHQQAADSHHRSRRMNMNNHMNDNNNNNNDNTDANLPEANRYFDDLIDEALQQYQFKQSYFQEAKQLIQLSINKYLLIYDTASTRLACVFTISGVLLNKSILSNTITILKYYQDQQLGILFDEDNSTIKLFTIKPTNNALQILRDIKCRRISTCNDIIFHATHLKYIYQSNLLGITDDLYFADALSEDTGQLPQLEYKHSVLQSYSTFDDQDYVVLSNQNTLIVHVIISQVQYTPNLGENELDIHEAIHEDTQERAVWKRINGNSRNNDSNTIHGNRNAGHRQRQMNGVSNRNGSSSSHTLAVNQDNNNNNNNNNNNSNTTGNIRNIASANDAFQQWETMLENEREQQQQQVQQQQNNNNNISSSQRNSQSQASNTANKKYLIQRRTSKETFSQPILSVHLINSRQLIIQCQNACYLYSLGARSIIKELKFDCPAMGKYFSISNIFLNSQNNPLERFTKLQAKTISVISNKIDDQIARVIKASKGLSGGLFDYCKPRLIKIALSTASYHQQSNSLKVFVPDRSDLEGSSVNVAKQYGQDVFKLGLVSINLGDLD